MPVTAAPAAHDVGRPRHGRPVGGPPAGASAGPVRGAAGGRPVLRLAAGHRLRLLQPGLRDPGPRHHERRRRRVPGGRPGPVPRAPGHDFDDVPRGGDAGGPPRPRLRPARGDASFARARTRTARWPRWAACSRAWRTWRAGWPGSWTPSPPATTPEGGHPLRRSTRREMQQVHRLIAPEVPAHAPDAEPRRCPAGTGSGCSCTADPDLGTTVSHAGGYPGFGSHMAWHPATGLGVIGLGNVRYAPVRPIVAEMLAMLVRAEAAPIPGGASSPCRRSWRSGRWSTACSHAGTTRRPMRVFAMNMDLDEPRDLRRAAFQRRWPSDLGPFLPDPMTCRSSRTRPRTFAGGCGGSGAASSWTILVTPEAGAPDPAAGPDRGGRPIVRPSGRGGADPGARRPARWPTGRATCRRVGDWTRRSVLRSMRAGGARFGAMHLGARDCGRWPHDGDLGAGDGAGPGHPAGGAGRGFWRRHRSGASCSGAGDAVRGLVAEPGRRPSDGRTSDGGRPMGDGSLGRSRDPRCPSPATPGRARPEHADARPVESAGRPATRSSLG